MSLALRLIAHRTEDEGRLGACSGHIGGVLDVGEEVGEAREYPGEGGRGRRRDKI